MTSPRQKKKKFAILKMLKKQKESAESVLEKLTVIEMNKNMLKGSEKHDIDRSDQLEHKQTELTDKNKNGLKELKTKKNSKFASVTEQNKAVTDPLTEETKNVTVSEQTNKVDDQ